MAILKCKMCGGDFEVNTESNILECEYCGTKQTIPNVDNEKKVNLFNRANRLRINCEFDKAATIYENIISEFPEEAEAYWGLCLCNYGIEYVDDSATAKKIPTCHRASFESLQKDENYELALEYSDVMAQKVYRDEAREIDRIMNEILAVSKSEKPYDIFICYKETDEHGNRTVDSVLAYDIYEALTAKGYNVFFSRVTLEDKLGRQYEPYIFAALNSAKVMLSIGTKYEYFHAVWVKNEWSRFLKLMAKDRTKLLIPCYKDMDPYDMPDEFKALQAQDMGKLGAMQDLLRGVEKILPKNNSVQTAKETVVVQQSSGNATVDSLLKRAFMFLEDGEWERADEFCEQVLNIDPECAQAYIGKLMADLKVKKQDKLKDCSDPFDKNNNYNKILRFGDEDLKQELLGYIDFINYRITKKIEQEKETNKIRKLVESMPNMIIANSICSLGLKADGTVLAVGYDGDSRFDVDSWHDIVAISSGYNYTIGLKANGTVVTTDYFGDEEYNYGQCDVSSFSNIVDISTSGSHTVGVKADGTVVAVGRNDSGECNVGSWCDIVAVSARGIKTIGLKADGTVVATGNNCFGMCNVSEWHNIISISASRSHTVGLKSDGTVVAVGRNDSGECNVSSWCNIVAVSAGEDYTIGLKANGTVVTTDYLGDERFNYGQCDVEDWTNIVAVSAGRGNSIGLKSDGTLVATGDNEFGQCHVEKWCLFDSGCDLENRQQYIKESRAAAKIRLVAETEEARKESIYQDATAKYNLFLIEACKEAVKLFESISGYKDADDKKKLALERVDYLVREEARYLENVEKEKLRIRKIFQSTPSMIAAGHNYIVGLKADGTVVATGENDYGQCDVGGWSDIIAVSAGSTHTVALKGDGTVVAVGLNNTGQCNVDKWQDIVAISASNAHSVGVKSDGTVVATGLNGYGQCDVGKWRDIIAVAVGDSHTVGLKSDGTVVAVGCNEFGQCDVSSWCDIVAVSARGSNTIGLKADGTVVATGNNCYGECNVSEWHNIISISASWHHTVGLKADGTVVAVGSNKYGKCDVKEWRDIIDIACNCENLTIGIKSDKTIVTAGSNEHNQRKVQSWKLFDSLESLEQRSKEIEKVKAKVKEQAKIKAQRRSEGLCQHCGGQLKGLFAKKCVNCGKPKDY